ncbi:MAG: glycosyltransferase family 9 protein [Candidatus Omnitrophota bacterium]|jgi:lipopolysaccharide heptosyltransferase II
MKKILVANIFGIGDVLFTTPLIASLKKEMNAVEIGYLCNARTRPVLECNPEIEDIFVYEKDDLAALWKSSRAKCLKTVYKLFSDIRKKKYDAVFDFTLSREFGFFFFLAGIPRRIGLDYKNRGIFLTDRLEFTGFSGKHVTEYYLDLLRFMGVEPSVKELQLVPDEEAREWASSYLSEHGAQGSSLAAVIPGGGASWGGDAFRKRWTPEGFSYVADILAGQGIALAVLGDVNEKDLCGSVAGKMKKRPPILENGLSLDKYIALLSACDLVLCNDGGPLHIAVALGVNTVSVFGPVDQKVYGPYPLSGKNKVITAHEVPCRPCYDRFKLPECEYENRCLTDIDPEVVAGACMEVLGKKDDV